MEGTLGTLDIKSGPTRCQTLASAYVLCPFQTLVPRLQNKKDGVSEIGGLE